MTITYLADETFIGGTHKTLDFLLYNEYESPLAVAGGTLTWLLCPYGEFNQAVLQKSGVISDTYMFTVTLASSDTLTLAGKYIQQVIVTDSSGDTYRAGQGNIIILPAI